MRRWTEEELAAIQAKGAARKPQAVILPPIVITPKKGGVQAPLKPSAKQKRGMNGLETRFSQHLELLKAAGEVQWWTYEAIKLKIAKGQHPAFFTPDFVSLDSETHRLTFYDTKGFSREAARLRIKVAAGMYPHFRFVVVTEENGRANWWKFEEFAP